MDLLRDIDEKQTSRNVEKFFKVKVPRLQRYATPTLGSPRFDKIGSGGAKNNGQEEKFVKAAAAASELRKVIAAVDACDDLSRCIIRGLYFSGKSDREMMLRVNYQPTQYYSRRSTALCKFADFYDGFDGLDLHEYL